ncbi:hypothetical protein BH24ACT4_BH24ACT4_13810 [soil metagenome]
MRTRLVPSRVATAVLAAVLLLAAACGGGSDDSGTAARDRSSTADAPTADKESPGGPATTIAPESGADSADEGSDRSSSEEAAPSDPDQTAVDPTLAAGRVDDGERWEEYLLYREDARRNGVPLASLDVDARRVVTVVDRDDKPVRGAVVDVLDGAGEVAATVRTHADGRAVVFAAPGGGASTDQQQGGGISYRVRSAAGDVTDEVPSDTLAPVLRTPGARPAAAPDVDLHFILDATGSMGDEIERLKATLSSVVEGIGDLPGSPQVRLGMTVYRDQGDAFVTRTVPFTTDAAAFVEELHTVSADGGGDTPEAVEPALAAALDEVAWSEDPGTVKLAFLVADAPPHLDGIDAECGPVEGPIPGERPGSAEDGTSSDIADPVPPCAVVADDDGPFYGDTATRFAQAGIKIVPVASSNLDPVGESVFRELALVTQAPFLFLTYGADGVSPGDQRPDLNVDDFAVLSLDEMVARVVAEELEATA